MQLYCPTCRTAAAAADRCPHCGGRLVTPAEAAAGRLPGPAIPPDLIRPTATARVAVGTVVALGLMLGLREVALGTVALLAGNEVSAAAAGPLAITLSTAAVLAGGLTAGAGRRNGAVTGGLVGLVAGTLLVAAAGLTGDRPPSRPANFGLVGGLAVVAAVAGLAGGRVWPPAVDIPLPDARGRGSSLARLAAAASDEGPPPAVISWVRVGLGAALAVVGVVGADAVRAGVKGGSAGMLHLGSPVQVPVVDGLIAAAAVGLAGLAAGGTTLSGWRHGLFAGGLAAAVVAGLVAAGSPSVLPPVEGLLELAGRTNAPPASRTGLAVTVAAVVVAGTIGGAFGGVLLPALGPPRQSRRRLD